MDARYIIYVGQFTAASPPKFFKIKRYKISKFQLKKRLLDPKIPFQVVNYALFPLHSP